MTTHNRKKPAKRTPLEPEPIDVDRFLAQEETPFVPGGLYLDMAPAGWRVGTLLSSEQVGGGNIAGSMHFHGRVPTSVSPGKPPLTTFKYLGGGVPLEGVMALSEALQED